MHALLPVLLLLGGCSSEGEEVFGQAPISFQVATCNAAPKLEPFWELGEEALVPEVDPDAAGRQVVVLGGPGVALGDLDGDGWQDAVMAVPVASSAVLHNDGAGRLQPVEARLDGAPFPPAASVLFADLDDDGDLDLVLGLPTGSADLIAWNTGDGRTFTSTPLPGSEGETFTPTLADVDGDGDLDLHVARLTLEAGSPDILSGQATGDPNSLYLREGDGFVDASDLLPPETQEDLSFMASWLDVDQDGDLDAYISNDFGPWMDPNRVLVNDGGGSFTLAADTGGERRMGAMGGAVGDADGDGIADVYVTNVGGPVLLRGDGQGGFIDATLSMGVDVPYDEHHLASWGSTFVDLDHDGDQDLAVAFGALVGGAADPDAQWQESGYADMLEDMFGEDAADWVDATDQRDVLFLNDGGQGFTDESTSLGFDVGAIGRAVAVGDLDRDGRPDLVTAGVPFLRQFHSRGGCGAGATLRLYDGPGNPHGIGATLDVVGDQVAYRTWHQPATTFSQSQLDVLLGLGEGGSADVTITWPDGGQTMVEDVRAGEVVDVVR